MRMTVPSRMGDSGRYCSLPSSARSPALISTGVVCVWKPAQHDSAGGGRASGFGRRGRVHASARRCPCVEQGQARTAPAAAHANTAQQPCSTTSRPRTRDGLGPPRLRDDVHRLAQPHRHAQRLAGLVDSQQHAGLHGGREAVQQVVVLGAKRGLEVLSSSQHRQQPGQRDACRGAGAAMGQQVMGDDGRQQRVRCEASVCDRRPAELAAAWTSAACKRRAWTTRAASPDSSWWSVW